MDVVFVETRADAVEGGEDGAWGVPRDWREDAFAEFMDSAGLDYHGHACGEDSPFVPFVAEFAEGDPRSHYVIDTPLFVLRPYYWGDEESVHRLPNFIYKPWRFEVSWYKYPMRGAVSNCLLSDAEWREMLGACSAYVQSLRGGTAFEMPPDCDKRTDLDVLAGEWSERLHRMTASADRYWGAATRLLRALQDGEGLDGAIASAMADTGWDEGFDGPIDASRWSFR